MRVGAPFQDQIVQIVQIVPRVTENATINQREQERESTCNRTELTELAVDSTVSNDGSKSRDI